MIFFLFSGWDLRRYWGAFSNRFTLRLFAIPLRPLRFDFQKLELSRKDRKRFGFQTSWKRR
jgi:hypothetical protein